MPVKIGVIAKHYGVTTECIRQWERDGKIKSIRTVKGTRLFEVPKDEVPKDEDRIKVFYCRVSSRKQVQDLDRQILLAKEEYPEHEVITDIGSGLNWKRKGLRNILARTSQGKISEVVVFHKDRLCRFGFEILEYILDLNDTRLVVQEQGEHKSRSEELSEDLMAITYIFSCGYYGSRRYTSKKDKILSDEDPGEDIEDEPYSPSFHIQYGCRKE